MSPTDAPASTAHDAIVVDNLRHVYGTREALGGISLTVPPGEIFALLGPNGGGKTTLFKILSTLLHPTSGSARVFGHDTVRAQAAVRRTLGVVFQHPSLDPMLSVTENLTHHGRLYGLAGSVLRERSRVLLDRLGLTDRATERVARLSGGMQRRVELAKGLLHQPRLLLLDEPSTGLDPGARREFTRTLAELRETTGATIVLTTHILDVAERCDRVGILDRGRLVAIDAPDTLRASIGGDVVVMDAPDPEGLRARIAERFACAPVVLDGTVRIERPRGHEFVSEVAAAFPGETRSISVGQPTLEDVFVQRTGHRFDDSHSDDQTSASSS
jgi:ABC-2 type transport system ATP-binding protein